MFKTLSFTVILLALVNVVSAQLVVDASFNATSFCGVNNLLNMQDISSGGVVSSRTWSVIGPNAFTPYSGNGLLANVTLTAIGSYTVTLTVCDAAANCNTQVFNNIITVLPKPDANINITSLCKNRPNVFNAAIVPASLAMDSFKWNFGEVGSNLSGTTKQQIYSFNNTGNKTIELIVKAVNGCKDTTTRSIDVLELPKAIINASDTFVCVGNSVNVSGLNSTKSTASLTYGWDTDYNTGIDNNNASFTILANTNKTVMLVVQDENLCTDTAFQVLNTAQNPEVNISNFTAKCVNTPFELNGIVSANGGAPIDSMYWFIDSTTYITGQNITYSHPVGERISVILFAVNEQGCSDGLQKYINIDAAADANILTNDTIICAGETLSILSEGSSTFYWSLDSSKQRNLEVSPTENTIYTLVGISENGVCPNSEDEILVEVIQEPEYIFNVSSENPGLGTPVFLNLSYTPQFSNLDTIKWLYSDTKNVLAYEFGEENNFIATENASFPIEIKYNQDEKICVFNTNFDVQVNTNCDSKNILVPNVFTPNNDGLNESFIIKGYSMQALKSLAIYDRSGKEMYFEENIEFKNGVAKSGWNGNDKNNVKCNSGVYVYYYKTVCVNGLESQGSGNIAIFR